MLKLLTALAFASLALLFVITEAQSQVVCFPAKEIKGQLEKQLGEVLVGAGVTASGEVINVLAGPDSWTILILLPDGRACPVADGTVWQNYPRSLPGQES